MNNKRQSKAKRTPKGARRMDCVCSGRGKPTVTRPSGRASGHYVASKSKTNSGMLHQSRTLEAPVADTARDRHETGGGRRATGKLAGNMVEVSAVERQPLPVSRDTETGRKTGSSVQVFVLGKNKKPLMPCSAARARKLLKKVRLPR